MTMYELSRGFWDFAFENPEKIKPVHISIYFFSVEHCNRLGWKKKFGLPASMVIEAIGVKSYSVYKKAFDELVSFGFIEVVEYSKNQYSSNIIALKDSYKANCKALDKALTKHVSKHPQSTCESTDSIIKQLNNKQDNEVTGFLPPAIFETNLNRKPIIPTKQEVLEHFIRNGGTKEMAKSYWDRNEATNWFFKGSPITNFSSQVYWFIQNWKKNENGKNIEFKSTSAPLKTADQL
jgi:hypothetical protein